MNVLPKGTMTVTITTMIASSLILFLGNTVADSAKPIIKVESSAMNKVEKHVVGTTIDTRKISSNPNNITSRPPPGPYFVKSIGEDQVKELLLKKQSIDHVIISDTEAPAAPVLGLKKPLLQESQPKLGSTTIVNKKPKLNPALRLESPEFKRFQPTIPVAPAQPSSISKINNKLLVEIEQPIQKEVIINEPSAPVNTLKEPMLEKRKNQVVIMDKPEMVKHELSKPSPPVVKLVKPILQKSDIAQAKAGRVVDMKQSAPSRPIWVSKPPVVKSGAPKPPIKQLQAGSVPTPRMMPNYNGWRPPVSRQFIYVPMPVVRPNFGYQPNWPTNNAKFIAPLPNYVVPMNQVKLGQKKLQNSQTHNNIEIK